MSITTPASSPKAGMKSSNTRNAIDPITAPTPMTGAQILCRALEHEGVEILFGYPGGAIMPFYDALSSSSLRHILVRHEQAAAHAADGYARATGRVGVCVATSGPGATNLVTGLATAFMDSVPLVAITGQVATRLIGTDAFQETDIIGVTQPITKHSIQVRRVEDIATAVHAAFTIARDGRPGPVVLDVPKDVQLATGSTPAPYTPASPKRPTLTGDLAAVVQRAADLIATAEHPVIIAGHGVIISGAYAELRLLAERAEIPTVTTLLGISAFPESHPLALGMPGMHGTKAANRAIHAADVLIAVGMRFDDRVTGKIAEFAPHAKIIHIDIDPSEMGKVLAPTVMIVADARVALRALADAVPVMHRETWLATVHGWATEAPSAPLAHSDVPTSPEPRAILAAIRAATNGDALIISDVGQHQMWTAQHYGYERPNSHFTSGGLGTMGFALPAAMGVVVGCPDRPVWAIAGDGGIQMNIQELATIVAQGLPIKIAIMNNGYLGMVRQWQEFFHDRNYSETRMTGPDYPLLAAAYGMTGFRVTTADEIAPTVAKAMAIPGPVIIDFVIEQMANVFPMVAPGTANVDMVHQSPSAGGTK